MPLSLLEENQGQYMGLPSNPRTIRDEKFDLLKKNIQEHPEFLAYNALKVLPMDDGKYIIIGGNMRYRAMLDLGMTEAPCTIIDKDTPIDDLKAYVVLDNSPFGQWDWQMLQSEDWDADQLQDWGVEMPMMETDVDIDDFFDNLDESEQKEKPELITIVLPEDLKKQKGEIKETIKTALSKYSGISFK